LINKKYKWIDDPTKLIVANLALLTVIFIPINHFAVELIFGSNTTIYSAIQVYLIKLNNLFTAIIILLYLNNSYFLSSWKKSVIKTQELSKSQVKFELLKKFESRRIYI